MNRFNSTIKLKMCKCGCGKPPVMGYNGYAGKYHMPQDMQNLPRYNKKAVSIRKQSIKSALARKLHDVNDDSKTKQWEWFLERRKEMTGICQNCGGRTTKNDEDKFHYSISHLLPKAYFASVATHKDNWLELCYYGKSCHANLDNHMLDLIDLNCFDQVITKFVSIYPSIAKEERRRIPAILLQYLDVET